MSQAIVFTHLPLPMPKPVTQPNGNAIRSLQEKVIPTFKAFLMCPSISLVYVYVDTSLRAAFQHLNNMRVNARGAFPPRALVLDIDEIAFEETTRNILKHALDLAIQDLRTDPAFSRSHAPRFQFVGLPHLINLVHSLYQADPGLLVDLAGQNGVFTYDSPKFVEAIIRLVKGREGNSMPVFRFDEDVRANDQGVRALLLKLHSLTKQQEQSAFFSGGYGTPGQPLDPVNDFAVRLHWLVDAEAYNLAQERNDRVAMAASLGTGGQIFLRDLGEIGASQVASLSHMSAEMTRVLKFCRNGKCMNRNTQQVISGAGLYMSPSAIRLLPPFMNFGTLTTWVDDHLKRRLHEALGNPGAGDVEHLTEALFQQNRNPHGIREADLHLAEENYFERLLRGCILHSLIQSDDGEPGLLAQAVWHLLPPRAGVFDAANRRRLKQELLARAIPAGMRVLEVWSTKEYSSPILQTWASNNMPSIPALAEPLVEDALNYLRLVSRWHRYVAAIDRLTPAQAYWLFRSA